MSGIVVERQKHLLCRAAFLVMGLYVPAASFAQGFTGDSFVSVWKNNAKSAYSLTTDDDRPSQVYTIAPALTERGLHGTFYVNPSSTRAGWAYFLNVGDVNGDGLLDGYLHLPGQGHELGSHTLDHWAVTVGNPQPSYPDAVFPSYEALAEDCEYVNAYLENLTGQRVVSFAYPWGKNDAESRATLADYYLSSRTIDGVAPSGGHYIPNTETPDMMRLRCFLAEGEYSWTNFKVYEEAMSSYGLMLSDTIAAGGWGIEFSHHTGYDWEDYYSNFNDINEDAYYEHLDNIVAARDAGDIWQDTVGNVSRYIYSREAASIEYGTITGTSIELRVDDVLDDDLYNVPLTVNTLIQEFWVDDLVITHNGQPVEYTVYNDALSGNTYASYDVVADGNPVVLDWAGTLPFTVGGDYDNDGDVDIDDWIRWRSDFGTTVAEPGLGSDGNGDGIVNAGDYVVWRNNLGMEIAPAPAPATVPEPATLIDLLLMEAVVCLFRPRPFGDGRAS